MSFFLENTKVWVFKTFFQKIFFENCWMVFGTQKVFVSNFFENKYFYFGPKGKVAPCAKVSKMAPTDKNCWNGIKNGRGVV